MSPSREFFPFETHGWPFYAVACLLVLVVLRLLRIADTGAHRTAPRPDAPPTSIVGWLRGRKLTKLASTTALSRAHTEFFHSKIDEIQAHHELERLVADLHPPPQNQVRQAAATAANAALTLAEIQDLLAVVDLDQQTRTDLLRLAAARLAEKRS